ncbi:MAG: hypothetical protein EXS06_06360, partial [Planctomycetaceae bacterium]|nr:hypothetical protein [Planctomycetaceae bacterium]
RASPGESSFPGDCCGAGRPAAGPVCGPPAPAGERPEGGLGGASGGRPGGRPGGGARARRPWQRVPARRPWPRAPARRPWP